MKWLTIALLITACTLASAEDQSEGKRHEYRGDTILTAPRGAKADWRPSARAKVNDSISILYPIDIKDLELFECSSNNSDVRVSLGVDEKGKGVRVGIRSGDSSSGGKKATAKVAWTITDFSGLAQRGYLDVVFE